MSPLLTHSDVQSPASRLESSNSQTVSSDTGKTVSNSMVQSPLVLASSTESSHESESSYDHLVPSIQPSESNPTQLSNSAQSSNTSFTLSSDNPTTSSTSSLLSITPKVVPIPHRPINSHTMQTRAKFGFSQPKLEPRLLLTHTEPKTVKQALADLQWKAAMQAEYDALIYNNTWTLVPLPSQRQTIGFKWVFRVKENSDGSVNRYKDILVAKGFHQRHGFDFNETFSPVVKPITIKIILTIAITYKWSIQQLDVNNAYFNGLVDEEVYMEQPKGFESSNSSLVCKLNKAVYGLK